jgi:hypothetical protein
MLCVIIYPDLLTVYFSAFQVLDARDIEDDFYLNLLDWGSQNLLTVSLGSCVYLWSPDTCGVTKLCDLSGGINIPTSVAWNKDVSSGQIYYLYSGHYKIFLLNLHPIVAIAISFLNFV